MGKLKVLFPAFSLLFSLSSASADMAAPCNPVTDQLGFRRCSDVKGDVVKALDTRIREQVGDYYQGCDRDTAVETRDTGKVCENFELPVCSLTANSFTGPLGAGGVEEVENNHLGQACGQWTYLRAQFRPIIKRWRLKRVDSTISPDVSGEYGKREQGYFRGAGIQAMSCFMAEVKREVGNNSLKISSACLGMKSDADGLTAEFQALRDKFKESGMSADTVNCDEKASDPTASAVLGATAGNAAVDQLKVADRHQLRQAACYLKAARFALEDVYLRLAECEVFDRSERAAIKFEEDFMSAGSLREEIKNTCKPRIRAGNASEGERQINECFRSEYLSRFKKRVQDWWPSTSATCRGA